MEWQAKIIITTAEEILGEKLPNIKIDVLVTHPNLYNGTILPGIQTQFVGGTEKIGKTIPWFT